MKIAIGVIVSACIATTSLHAQETYEDARRGGVIVKAGLSYGGVSNSGVFPGEDRSRNGFALGIGLVSGAPVGFGIEGLYAQRGIAARELDYIDVPAYLRLGMTNPAVEPFLYAGPQISFELRCETGSGADCPDDRPSVTYAGVIGGGLRLPQAAGLSIEARYLYGLSDLRLGTVTDSESYRTRSFLVLLGLGF